MCRSELKVSSRSPFLVVGFEGWRDFYAGLMADTLCADGIDAAAITIQMPEMGGNFDNWSLDYARYLDTPNGLAHLIAQIKPKLDGAT